MKTKKLLKRVREVLERAGGNKKVERSSLEELLKRLEEKEESLAEKLAGEKDAAKAAKLKRKIKLLKAQRKKGAETLSDFS
jgi:hypothetical protein